MLLWAKSLDIVLRVEERLLRTGAVLWVMVSLLRTLKKRPLLPRARGRRLSPRVTCRGCRKGRISPSNEYSELISFKMDWLDLLAVQRTLKSLL